MEIVEAKTTSLTANPHQAKVSKLHDSKRAQVSGSQGAAPERGNQAAISDFLSPDGGFFQERGFMTIAPITNVRIFGSLHSIRSRRGQAPFEAIYSCRGSYGARFGEGT